MNNEKTLFWFRQDLRLSDNPGLLEAAKKGSVLPVYILDDRFEMGRASKWWLHHSLEKLNAQLDFKLNVYVGQSHSIILDLIQKHKLTAVYWNRCYEPERIKDDAELALKLNRMDITSKHFNSSLLWEPWEVLKADKTPYKIYTPFYHHGCLKKSPPRLPLPAPENLILLQAAHNGIDSLNLLPSIKWYTSLESHWEVGETAAQNQLLQFLDYTLPGYKEKRDYPHKRQVSSLSPHLHFGEISPHQVWHMAKAKSPTEDLDHFLREIAWREFSYYLLYHFPELPHKNFQPKFDQFPWNYDPHQLRAWQKGQTGYPIVDAGMRELWQTGYMHNRVRMIVASFLVKNLLQDWRHGAEWFWDCLVDADLANNSASWQWVAGSGADASPYFRIFNPILQGEKFDSEGLYTRQFLPELAQLPNKFLFKPWEAPEHVLKASNVVLGQTYPKPIVDIKTSRDRAMDAYHSLKGKVLDEEYE